MNFTARTIPYRQAGFFSKIITDYLDGNQALKPFYNHSVSVAGIEASIHEREVFPTDRKLLVQALDEQYLGLPVSDAVEKNRNSLLLENTFTITTAHQPAIFTGTLYFIYKILHVIKISRALKARFPEKNFVPVFYMGSEDADLDELGHLYLNAEKIVWNTSQTGAVGRMKTDGLEEIIHRIEGEFSGQPYGPEMIAMLKDCYLHAENIQQATLHFLNRLFGEYGLIILIPDSRLFKSAMRGVFKDDLTGHIPYQITEKNIQELSERYPIQANPREINLFYLLNDKRERLEWKDGQFHVLNTSLTFSPAEMEKELANFPERFSPNVILRGLFQETILPNIGFVGGGGETAYWLELKPLFKHYRIPYPVLIIRNSFLLIKKNWKSKMERTGLLPEDFFQPEEPLMELWVRKNSSKQLNLDEELNRLRNFYEEIKKVSGTVDKTLEQHVEKLSVQAIQKLEELEKKIIRAEKKNHEELRKKINEIRQALFPLGNLQERVENFIPWYAEYGPSFLDILLEHSLALEQQFVILEENQ